MLNNDLERVWNRTAEDERRKAKARAEIILGNLVHYPISRRAHYDSDVELLAANLIHWHVERSNKN